jgi:alanyl-tRNA synthetase
MDSAAIRRKFLDFFVAHGHTEVASSSLEPRDDPTLLFTNAGMVQFKRTFLGQDPREYTRATSCQKCVRAGGKHNDLEQVGLTRRHHTFFEMLGNFSFGDYFKRDAIRYAWEFVTSPEWLGISPDRLRVTVHHTDDDAHQLWLDHSTLPADRIYRLGDADNFWQMGDTGPCGPCSEIFVDLRWRPGDAPEVIPQPEFESQAEAGRFLEIWNLVFMQFDRAADGTLTPLPKPSVDTGAGLERVTAVMEGADDNFHTDLFQPLLDRVEQLVGRAYPGGPEGEGLSFRVLADHARAATFLIHDGVYPGNEGRGFVLRRIIRRAVRHAWLMGQREPMLFQLVDVVVQVMGGAYPTLRDKQAEITEWIRTEEARFFETIEAGMNRLEQIHASGTTRIGGDDAFKLFDTYGFPIDLTQLIAGEWGIDVDVEGFERAMREQRERSRAARTGFMTASADGHGTASGTLSATYDRADAPDEPRFVGYNALRVETEIISARWNPGTAEIVLHDNPFYAGGGGQIADIGTVTGDGWTLQVDEVLRDEKKRAVLRGTLKGSIVDLTAPVTATVNESRRRDIERNHSATHLVHMALRRALGSHVRQQGSLVEPGRLRFDFSHHGPIDASQLADIEAEVNELILSNAETDVREMALQDALKLGAMAFFADKYGDVVRVVRIGDSIELCGGTHVRSAGQIGLFRFTAQGGVAAGVRRIEAATGHGAYGSVKSLDDRITTLAAALRAQPDQLERKIEALLAERERLEARLAEAIKGGGSTEGREFDAGPIRLVVTPTVAEGRGQLGEMADAFRQQRGTNAMLVLVNPTAPNAIAVAVTDDLIAAGKDANAFVKLVTSRFGGRGGGRPTFASGSLAVPDVAQVATAEFPDIVRAWMAE